jgi:hypothetical protein
LWRLENYIGIGHQKLSEINLSCTSSETVSEQPYNIFFLFLWIGISFNCLCNQQHKMAHSSLTCEKTQWFHCHKYRCLYHGLSASHVDKTFVVALTGISMTTE